MLPRLHWTVADEVSRIGPFASGWPEKSGAGEAPKSHRRGRDLRGRSELMATVQRIRREISEWFRALLRAVPGELGCWLRRWAYGFAAAGAATRVLSNVIVYSPEQLTLGNDVGIAVGCQLNARGGITIGNDVRIGPGTLLWTQNHRFSDAETPISQQGYDRAPIVIEDDVWIAAGCIILPGVTLGRGCVVAAGAVVTKSTEPMSIVAGVPARAIGRRGAAEPTTSG